MHVSNQVNQSHWNFGNAFAQRFRFIVSAAFFSPLWGSSKLIHFFVFQNFTIMRIIINTDSGEVTTVVSFAVTEGPER